MACYIRVISIDCMQVVYMCPASSKLHALPEQIQSPISQLINLCVYQLYTSVVLIPSYRPLASNVIQMFTLFTPHTTPAATSC